MLGIMAWFYKGSQEQTAFNFRASFSNLIPIILVQKIVYASGNYAALGKIKDTHKKWLISWV